MIDNCCSPPPRDVEAQEAVWCGLANGTFQVMSSDADIAIREPQLEVTVDHDMLHDNAGYTPYEGRRITGWPVTVRSRGRVVVDDGTLNAERGSGEFLRCEKSISAQAAGNPVLELDPKSNFGAELL